MKDRRYGHALPERFGLIPHSYQRTVYGAIWLHAVSVGEVLSVVELIRRLRGDYPNSGLFVSCSTLAGREVAQDKLSSMVDGIFYAPFDYCFAVRRVLRTIRPLMLIVLETEIWPNLYRESKLAGCSLLMLNARISVRALPRYRKLHWFFEQVLDLPDRVLAQSREDLENFVQLGAPADRAEEVGNLKYDFDPSSSEPPSAVTAFLAAVKPGPVWIAASTVAPVVPHDVDEDDEVIRVYREIAAAHPDLVLLIAPRKPERFDAVAEKLKTASIPFARRSVMQTEEKARVLLLDSIGELSSLFRFADVVFMGGSLAERGGHNIVEPAFFGRPVIIGPNMQNFPEITRRFVSGEGVVQIGSAGELRPAIERLLDSEELRRTVGERARSIAEAQRGAGARAMEAVRELYERAIPHVLPYGPLRYIQWLLARFWRAGSERKRRNDLARQQRLSTAVVSIGGIAMGGAGKTPLVSFLSEKLAAKGYAPAILTRGYKRRSPEKSTVLEPGGRAPVALTGDEAQIFLREGLAPLGIGANRYRTGVLMQQRFSPSVFLLDDGYQHARLARDLDIVALDALDPFAGGELFPAGRLREPLDALGRAGAFVITRVEPGRTYNGIKEMLRRWNPTAPVFHARVVPLGWVNPVTGERLAPDTLNDYMKAAFCGLANPGAFWRTLHLLGCRPAFKWAFGDHHHYKQSEVAQLAERARIAGARMLLTTEKDLMNLPPAWEEIIAPLELYWLKIGLMVEEEEPLLALIESRLDARGLVKKN
ncbi:MAG: tetraacyldisaccharide 4'-kinase [Bryobacteraceae bacterium]